MNLQASGDLRYWVPEKMIASCPEAACRWLYVGDKTFTEPFFGDTAAACKRPVGKEKRFRSVSSLETMADWAGKADTVAPAAIIFHISRCGSTLLSQLLSIDQQHIVLSEVPFFDELLRLPYKDALPAPVADRYLHAAIKLYGQIRHGIEQQVFIKTDSWHIHFYGRLRALYPAIPFILLYRNPAEVIRSQQKQRGLQSVPGLVEPQIFGFSLPAEANLDLYMSSVLASYFKKMIEVVMHDPLAFAFNYSDGMSNIIRAVYRLCHLTPGKEIIEKTGDRCRFHAKHPQQPFSEDQPEESMPCFLESVFSLYGKMDFLSKEKTGSTNYFLC